MRLRLNCACSNVSLRVFLFFFCHRCCCCWCVAAAAVVTIGTDFSGRYFIKKCAKDTLANNCTHSTTILTKLISRLTMGDVIILGHPLRFARSRSSFIFHKHYSSVCRSLWALVRIHMDSLHMRSMQVDANTQRAHIGIQAASTQHVSFPPV